jgi:ABC-2 type transport system permease protein
MQAKNLPALDARYWAAILVASLLGTTCGDFVANDLHLGFAGGLLPSAALFAIALLAERRAEVPRELYYWTAIVTSRTAATNLGDFTTHDLNFGFARGSLLLAAIFVALFLTARRRVAASSGSESVVIDKPAKALPAVNAGYWAMILAASTLGTTLGDFVAGDLGLGLGKASLVLGGLFALVWTIESKARVSNDARYWVAIIVVRTAGTVMGDFLTGEEGLDWGFGWGAATVGLLLILTLRVGRRSAPGDYSRDSSLRISFERRFPIVRAICGMAMNDLAVWLRSPAAIAAALLPALGMGVLVAVLTASVGRQPVGLVVQGEGRFAERMARLIEGDNDAYQLQRMTVDAAESAFGDQRIAAIIVVPADFDARVARWDASVDLYLNNVNIDIADDLRRAVTRSVAEFDAPQLGLLGELHGPSKGVLLPNPYRVAVAEHDVRETEVSFLQYQVIPIILLVVISVGLLGTALLTARDFERGTAKMMVLSPAGRLPLVLGRLLGGTLITGALVAPLVGLGFLTHYIPYCREESGASLWVSLLLSGPCGWMLPIPPWTHALALVGLFAAVTLTTVGLGTLLGVALRDARLVTMAGLNGAAYMFFLGGGFTTVAFLPDWIQTVSRFVPTSYAINGLRQALFYPDLVGFERDLIVLLVCAAMSVLLASFALARAWRRA